MFSGEHDLNDLIHSHTLLGNGSSGLTAQYRESVSKSSISKPSPDAKHSRPWVLPQPELVAILRVSALPIASSTDSLAASMFHLRSSQAQRTGYSPDTTERTRATHLHALVRTGHSTGRGSQLVRPVRYPPARRRCGAVDRFFLYMSRRRSLVAGCSTSAVP